MEREHLARLLPAGSLRSIFIHRGGQLPMSSPLQIMVVQLLDGFG
jgi:hypothetical protein